MIQGVLIPADAQAPVREVQLSDTNGCSTIIGSSTDRTDIEKLDVTVHVHHNGLAEGLQFNARATRLWWAHQPALIDGPRLYGDAVLVGTETVEGRANDVPDTLRRLLTEDGNYSVLLNVASQPWELRESNHENYFSAVTSAVVLLTCWPGAQDMRVLPSEEVEPFLEEHRAHPV